MLVRAILRAVSELVTAPAQLAGVLPPAWPTVSRAARGSFIPVVACLIRDRSVAAAWRVSWPSASGSSSCACSRVREINPAVGVDQLQCGCAELADAELRSLHDAFVENGLDVLVCDWPSVATFEHHYLAHEQDPLLECARHVREGWANEPCKYHAELLQ